MKTNILGLVITLVVGIILAGSLLVPVLDDAKKDLGNPITLTNESQQYMSLSNGDVEISLADNVLTVNGETYTFVTTDRIIFACDSFVAYYNGSNAYGSYLNMQSGIRNITAFEASVTDGLLNASVTYEGVVDPETVTDRPVAFSFYIDPDGDYSYFSPQYVQPYVKSIKDLYAFGAYYTGDNDTYYWYYNGVAGGYSEDYTYGMTATISLADNTTDLFKASDIVYSVGDETFTPFSMIVAKEVAGHATAGATYSLLSTIPILVIVSLVLAAVGMIYVRRND